MDYIVYTTEGYTELPVASPTENCQIIDFLEGATDSIANLKDKYAKQLGLQTEDIHIVQYVNQESLEAINKIVKYFLTDRKAHFKDSEENESDSHIYQSLKQLANNFNIQTKT